MQVSSSHFKTALLLILLLSFNVVSQNDSATTRSDIEDLAISLTALNSPQEQELLLARKKDLLTPDLRKALIRHGNAHLLAGRYSKAFDIYSLAQKIAEQIADKEGVATASLDIGTVYYFQANYPAALAQYKKARELFIEVTNDYESAKALSGLALIYKEQRRDKEALEALQQALKEFTSLGDKEEIADTLNGIGAIHYAQGNYSAAAEAFSKSAEANNKAEAQVRLADALYMQGDYAQALNYYKQSLEKVSATDIGAYSASLNGAANSAFYQGNYEEALQYYQRNASIQERQSDKLGLATSLKGIGNVHRSRGDYAAALESYLSSLSISEQIKAPVGTVLGSIGIVRAMQGDYPRALDFYNKALKEFEANANKIDAARLLSLIGNLYYTRGSYDSAMGSYARALSLREEMDDKPGQGDILAAIGSTLLRQKDYDDALNAYQKALTLFNSVGNKERVADLLTRVADAFLQQGDYTRALSAAESAAALARQLDKAEVLWPARVLAGKAQQKLQHGPQAYQSFTEAVSIIESLRSRPGTIANGEHDSSLAYRAAIDFLMSEHHPGESLDYAERAKVQALFDVLRNNNALTNKGLSPAEYADEQRLAGQVASLELQLDRESQLRTSSETRGFNLRERLKQAGAAYADFRRKLFLAHPGLKVERGELLPLKLDEMRLLIGDTSTALLEFTITDTNTYLFVLSAEKATDNPRRRIEITLKVYPLEIQHEELAARVRQLEQQLSSRSEDFHASARELYDLLIKPADSQIALKTKLVIVPDGILWRVPFEALQPADDQYVLDQMQVSYALSLSALREQQKQRPSSSRLNSTLLAFGNPLLSKEFINRIEVAYGDTKLESSEQEEQEIKRVGSAYGATTSRLFNGAEASEERFRLEAARAGILHFSTPALLDDRSPMSSFVGLASGSRKEDDGFLKTREIINLQTSAQLAVLSAAQHRDNLNGAAIYGLSWSWFVAGSPLVMFNRWKPETEPGSRLLTQFYSTIKPTNRNRVSRATALRQSAISLRRSSEFKHPYYWAHFALIGDAR